MNLPHKTILITGASDGIGKEIALRLAKENCKLALMGRDEERLKEVAEKSKELGAADVNVYSCDLRQTDKLEIAIQTILGDFGVVDILINNAGIWQKCMPVDEIPGEVVDEVIGTNLTALIHVTRLFLPVLRTRDEAAIINIVSRSGVVAQEGQSVYTASKFGVHGFTEVLKADLKGSNVRVAGVYQGGTNTRMFEKTGENFPTEKFTNPADLADMIAYMLSRPAKLWLHDVRVEH